MKYRLICSVDEVNVDYEEIVEIDGDPSWGECAELQDIAEAHGCKFWSLDPLEDEGSENLTA